MIERTTDAAFLNRVINHPDVRPHLAGKDGYVDLTVAIKNPNNFALTGEYGGMLLVQHVTGVYELHTQVLPAGRGAWAYEMAQECMDWLFSRTNATEVFTRVPEGNVAAAALTRACGAKIEERVVQNLAGETVPVTIYSGRLQDWIRIAPNLEERGARFHAMLHAKYKAMKLPIIPHDEDAWHNRHVGAAAGMITGGQPIKGVLVYNRWAAMAFAPVMKLISIKPLILDITEARIEVNGDDFEVLPCPLQ